MKICLKRGKEVFIVAWVCFPDIRLGFTFGIMLRIGQMLNKMAAKSSSYMNSHSFNHYGDGSHPGEQIDLHTKSLEIRKNGLFFLVTLGALICPTPDPPIIFPTSVTCFHNQPHMSSAIYVSAILPILCASLSALLHHHYVFCSSYSAFLTLTFKSVFFCPDWLHVAICLCLYSGHQDVVAAFV